MFIKIGEPNPITVIESAELDDKDTKAALKKAIRTTKKMEIPARVNKESEKK